MRTRLKSLFARILSLSVSRKQKIPNPLNNLLILHHHFIGDMVFITPMISTLAAKFPKIQITVFCNRLTAPLLKGNPHVTRIIIDPTPITRKNSPILFLFKLLRNTPNIIALRQSRFEAVIDTSGFLDTVVLMTFIRCQFRIGHSIEHNYHRLYHHFTDISKPPAGHLKYRYLQLLSPLGITTKEFKTEYQIFLSAADREKAVVIFAAGQQQTLIAMAPFAGWQSKEWPLGISCKTAGLITAAFPDTLLVILGGSSDKSRLEKKELPWPSNTKFLAGSLSLPVTIAVIEKCALFIGLDSGLSHIAEALQRPSIEIYTSTNPVFSAPENTRLHRIIITEAVCRPRHPSQYCNDTDHFVCGHFDCHKSITPDTVSQAAIRLLNQARL